VPSAIRPCIVGKFPGDGDESDREQAQPRRKQQGQKGA
jgi:hypothetical protein